MRSSSVEFWQRADIPTHLGMPLLASSDREDLAMAGERLKESIRTQRSLGMKGEFWDNHTVARHTVDEEVGRLGEPTIYGYGFDDGIREVLLTHGRQDVAHALCNTRSLLDRG